VSEIPENGKGPALEGYGADFARLAGCCGVESIQPRMAPKTRKHIKVSQK
jgi:hypothetical protein